MASAPKTFMVAVAIAVVATTARTVTALVVVSRLRQVAAGSRSLHRPMAQK
jgi:hypothetical protein